MNSFDTEILMHFITDLFAENGSIENLQAMLIGIAFLMLVWMALTRAGAERTATLFLACVCFLSFFREMDLRAFDLPTWVIMLTPGGIGRVWYVGPFALIAFYVGKHREHLPAILNTLPRRWMWPLYVCLLLQVLAQSMDQFLPHSLMGTVVEEGTELLGYMFLVVGASRFLRGGVLLNHVPVADKFDLYSKKPHLPLY